MNRLKKAAVWGALAVIAGVIAADLFGVFPLYRLFPARCGGVSVAYDGSWFSDLSSAEGAVYVDCRLTLRNDSDAEKRCTLTAVMIPEFIGGSAASPALGAVDASTGETVFELGAQEERAFDVRFTAKRGWGRLFKMNRELPLIRIKAE